MTLADFYAIYKNNLIKQKKIICCYLKTQEGFEINNIEEFDEILKTFSDEVYLINEMENDEMLFFEYFIMNKAIPHIIVLKHPLMTNAYWSDVPDKIIDSFTSEENNIYRYLICDYGRGMKDYCIEFPPDIDSDIVNFCKSKMKQGFLTSKNNKGNSSITILFTNTDRFVSLDTSNFVTYELESLYDDWDIKRITTLNLSKKLWGDIKKIGE